jgi:hypothetical protein
MLTITIILFICGVFVPLAINKNSRIVNMLGVGSILGLSAKTIYQTIMNYLAQDGILITSFFQIPIIILGIAGAFHSIGYLRGHWEHRRGLYWALYFLTIFGMLSVI